MKLWLCVLVLAVVSSGSTSADSWRRHHGGGMYMPAPPVERQWRHEERWWRYDPPQSFVYCAPEQGPPHYDQFGNLVSCGPAPRW